MVVYADILILLNFTVDYFLISLVSRLLKSGSSLARQLLGAAAGGLSSLIIFLPQLDIWTELPIKAAVTAIIALIAFGFRSFRFFLRSIVFLLAVTFGYAGGMLALWQLLRPNGLIIRNSVVYLDISPLILIICSVIAYFTILLLQRILGKNGNAAESCEICVYFEGSSASFTAITDTGNSLEDIFGNSEIIIAEPEAVSSLFENKSETELARRYRALPCSTVGGTELLNGYRCDRAVIRTNGNEIKLSQPIVAISKAGFGGDYSAVINPKIIE